MLWGTTTYSFIDHHGSGLDKCQMDPIEEYVLLHYVILLLLLIVYSRCNYIYMFYQVCVKAKLNELIKVRVLFRLVL